MEMMINYYSMTHVKLQDYENHEGLRAVTKEPEREAKETEPVCEKKTRIAEYLTATYLG